MKLIRYIAAGLLAAGTTLALAQPASATEPDNAACGDWTAAYAVEAYPALLVSEPNGGSAVVSGDGAKVTLDKPDLADNVAGVEFVARDLDIEGPTTIKVHYALAGGATPDAGAVRIFGYADAGASTLSAAPDYGPAATEAASLPEGTLTLTVDGPLAILGVVYDASNTNADGTVTFSELRVGEAEARFTACPEPEETASPTPTAAPTKAPTTRPASAAPTGTPATLPVTGSGGGLNPLAILLPMAGALLLGGTGFALMRRRRDNPTFTAE